MKQLMMAVLALSVSACATDDAAKEQARKQQLELALKKIDIDCRDRYPMGVPGAIMKRKQCQQVGIESMQLPK